MELQIATIVIVLLVILDIISLRRKVNELDRVVSIFAESRAKELMKKVMGDIEVIMNKKDEPNKETKKRTVRKN